MQNDANLALGDTSVVLDNIERVRQLYLERGLTQEAAQVFPSAIHIALDRGEYEEAASMMQIFEKESGLFDEQGNIVQYREIYHYHKGKYYLGIHKLDSAEFQFRKLLKFDSTIINAYRGLLMLFHQKQNADSIYKYSILYEGALVDYLKETKSTAIVQTIGMYDYNRQLSIARAQENKARLRGIGIVIISLVAFLFFSTITLYYRRRKHNDQIALLHARESYIEAKNELARLQYEVSFLKDNLPQKEETEILLNKKEELRQKLLNQISCSLEELGLTAAYNKDEVELMNSDIVKLFKQIAIPHTIKEDGKSKIRQEEPRPFVDSEWEELVNAVKKYHYGLYYLITVKHKLPKQQFRVCILSRLHFSNQEMANLMNKSFSNISNFRSKVAKRLLGINDHSLLDEILPDI